MTIARWSDPYSLSHSVHLIRLFDDPSDARDRSTIDLCLEDFHVISSGISQLCRSNWSIKPMNGSASPCRYVSRMLGPPYVMSCLLLGLRCMFVYALHASCNISRSHPASVFFHSRLCILQCRLSDFNRLACPLPSAPMPKKPQVYHPAVANWKSPRARLDGQQRCVHCVLILILV